MVATAILVARSIFRFYPIVSLAASGAEADLPAQSRHEAAARTAQNMYFRLNCTSRLASVFEVTRPKLALVGSTVVQPLLVVDPAMLPQFGWLRKLKISALNWIFCVLATRTFLNSAMSHCCWPGL